MVTNITHVGENPHAEQKRGFEFGFLMVVGKKLDSEACNPIQNIWQEVQGILVVQETI